MELAESPSLVPASARSAATVLLGGWHGGTGGSVASRQPPRLLCWCARYSRSVWPVAGDAATCGRTPPEPRGRAPPPPGARTPRPTGGARLPPGRGGCIGGARASSRRQSRPAPWRQPRPAGSSAAAAAGSPRPDAAAYETWDEATRASVWDEAIRIEDSVVISPLLFKSRGKRTIHFKIAGVKIQS